MSVCSSQAVKVMKSSRRLKDYLEIHALPWLGCAGADQRSHDGGGHVVKQGQSSGVERWHRGGTRHAHHKAADANPEGHGKARD